MAVAAAASPGEQRCERDKRTLVVQVAARAPRNEVVSAHCGTTADAPRQQAAGQ